MSLNAREMEAARRIALELQAVDTDRRGEALEAAADHLKQATQGFTAYCLRAAAAAYAAPEEKHDAA